MLRVLPSLTNVIYVNIFYNYLLITLHDGSNQRSKIHIVSHWMHDAILM